jgi:signal transduction histidine kinase
VRNSLVWKLTFAFILVALTTTALVAVLIRTTSINRLSQLIVDQQRSSLQLVLEQYYTNTGSWTGINGQWMQIRQQSAPTPNTNGPSKNDHGQSSKGDHQVFFGLTDPQGSVLVPFDPQFPQGASLSSEIIKSGMPVTVNGKVVGTIVNMPVQPSFNPEENLFIQRTTEALIYAVIGAMLVAFIMGTLLARTLTRPLQALTLAAQNIAGGQLEQEVKISSKDELGRLASAFNKMSQEVARVNRLRRQMTADIAHDLRTPLLVIAGYIEAMRDGVLRPTPERLALIYTEIEHLQRLVSDLRMLSQVDAGELPLHPQPISPKSLLEHAAAPFVHRAETQHITLKVEAADPLPEIRVDEDRMMQVFGNLLSNALRYTPAGGEIRLSAQRVNGNIIMSVRDNGCGIPEEDLPFIFDRFYRVDKSRTDAGETGLGLAIVKAMVEAHNGKVWVESKLGEYSRFSIQFRS